MVRKITRRFTETLRRIDRALTREREIEAAFPQSLAGTCENESAMRGRLTFRNAGLLRKALFTLLGQRRRVISLVCDRVEFCDGAAIAAVLEFSLACKEQGIRLFFVDPSESLCDAFRLYRLHSMLDAMSTRQRVLPTHQAADLGEDALVIVLEDEFPDSIRIEPVQDAA